MVGGRLSVLTLLRTLTSNVDSSVTMYDSAFIDASTQRNSSLWDTGGALETASEELHDG